jgi:hypothetical protein
MEGSSVTSGVGDVGWPHIVKFRFARNSNIVFEPGEVKMFSAPSTHGGTLQALGEVTKFGKSVIDPVNLWNPDGLFLAPRATPQGGYGDEAPDAYNFNLKDLPDYRGTYENRENMVFAPDDKITFEVVTETINAGGYQDGRRESRNNGGTGSGFV